MVSGNGQVVMQLVYIRDMAGSVCEIMLAVAKWLMTNYIKQQQCTGILAYNIMQVK